MFMDHANRTSSDTPTNFHNLKDQFVSQISKNSISMNNKINNNNQQTKLSTFILTRYSKKAFIKLPVVDYIQSY